MNIPNQQRWRSFFRVRLLARRFHLKPTFDPSSVSLPVFGLSQIKGYPVLSKTSQHFRSCIILYMLRDIPLQPHYDFQQFCLVIIWRLIAQYTYIAGDTS
ncbi:MULTISPECIES: hypothetical protein [Planktothrix]|jgi:hypothetical protein|uniref:hypothetical protein n=1 Tax=Planktothrix TaxID=54304 RepID=UPI0003F75E9A|nr:MULTISPECIES: hypothetical protein [Planktothrix]